MRDHPIVLKSFVSSMLALLVLMNWTTILARPISPPAATISASKTHNLTFADPPTDPAASARIVPETDTTTRARVAAAYGRLPLSFEANQGQTDPRVKFLSRGSGYTLFLTAAESVLVLSAPPSKNFPACNTVGFADLTIRYGPTGATPVVGDWDGNGTVTIGVYDPSSQTFYLRNSNSIGFADLTIRYGPPGATPLAGDWNGL